jgi:hypothetical protein
MLACQEDLAYKTMVQIMINAGGNITALEPNEREPAIFDICSILWWR